MYNWISHFTYILLLHYLEQEAHLSQRDRATLPVIRTASAKKSPFSRIAAHIFVSPGDAPAIITQRAAWMERQFNACQTPRCVNLSVFNTFRVIRCLSQCVSSKIAILPHFCFSWGRPWGNHAKCCMDGKRIRCLQIVSLHYNYNRFWDTATYWSKIVNFSYPVAFDAPVRGVPVGITPPRFVRKN